MFFDRWTNRFALWNFAPEGAGGAPSSPSSPASSSSGSPASGSSSVPSSASPSGAPSTPGPSGPSSAPSAPSTSPTSTSPQPADGVGDGYNFEAVFGDDFFPSPTSPASPSAPAPAAPPVAPAAVAPSPQQPQPQPGQQQPAAPAATPAPSSQAQPAPTGQPGPQDPGTAGRPVLDPGDPSGIARVMHDQREQFVDHVSKNMFQLSNEDMAALEADVAGTVPRLLARTYVDTTIGLLTHMSRSVPLMVQRHLEVTKARDDAESGFYSKWPGLDKSNGKIRELVQQTAIAMRQLNPQMTTQEMYEAVGPIVMQRAGIAFAPPASSVSPGAPQPAAARPQVPIAGPNGTQMVPAPAPFVPAPPGTVGAALPHDPNTDYSFMAGGQDE
jgi:hypothetical protein